jgi:hypothetical protein
MYVACNISRDHHVPTMADRNAQSERQNSKGSEKKQIFGLDHREGHVVLGAVRMPLPRSRAARMATGIALVCGGLLGFLPILGFWMVPLGLLVLSQDLANVRRWRRRLSVWWAKRAGE